MMNKLVVFFSRTGTTKKVALEIADELGCAVEEIIDKKSRKGFFSWFVAGKDGSLKRPTIIEKVKHDPSTYDLVIVGTPIWVNTTPAIRTYLTQNAHKFQKLAFFCTMGGSEGKKLFSEMEALSGKKPVAVMELRESDVKNGNYKHTLQKFISKIK